MKESFYNMTEFNLSFNPGVVNDQKRNERKTVSCIFFKVFQAVIDFLIQRAGRRISKIRKYPGIDNSEKFLEIV